MFVFYRFNSNLSIDKKNRTILLVRHKYLWSDFETGMRKNYILCFKLSYIIRFINTNVT